MADIFISYKREERQFAERLSIALEQLGFDVWWDFDLMSGDRFRRVIEKVIDECQAAIVLWSDLSRQSEFVVDEATYANAQDKLCPVRIDDCRLPLGFGGMHVDDLRTWDGELDHPGMVALLRALEAKTGKKPRFGARPRTREDEAVATELESFKAAQIAGTALAFRAFLERFPDGTFAGFVRSQLATLKADAAPVGVAAQAAHGTAEMAPPPTQRPPPQESYSRPPEPPLDSTAEQKRAPPWPLIGAAAVAAICIAALFVVRPWEQTGTPTETPTETTAETLPETTTETPAPVTESAPEQAESAPPPQAAPAATQAYDLALLAPNIRATVREARDAEARASRAAARARDAATRGQDAARRARNGEAGYAVISNDSDAMRRSYEGQVQNGEIRGYGVASAAAGDAVGDTYAGQTDAEGMGPLGVYSFAGNENNRTSLRYEGEWRANQTEGFGITFSRNGDRYTGEHRDNKLTGLGVLRLADGSRYEGAVADRARSGYGVLWGADGRVIRQGVWDSDTLTTALAP